MSLSTLFALTFASTTIVFGNPLVDRLNVNESDSLLSEELITERRRLGYIWPKRVSYFEWPSCVTGLGGCTVMGVINQKLACLNNDDYHWCHQIKDAVYHVGDREGGKCYLALTLCEGCMNDPDDHPDDLKRVDCAPHRWYGSKTGRYDHMLKDDRQFIYKICVRSGSLIDGLKFYYKTPTDDSYSDFKLTESPWYGGRGGVLRCFEPNDYINRVYVKYDNRFPVALIFNGESTQRFGGGGRDSDSWKSFYGGVLRSVQLYHGRHPTISYDVITGLKFDWMDDDNANYMIYKMCHNGQFNCGL